MDRKRWKNYYVKSNLGKICHSRNKPYQILMWNLYGSLCIEITSRADWKQTGCGCKHGNSAMPMKNGAVTSI
jgi:hypothetical protein